MPPKKQRTIKANTIGGGISLNSLWLERYESNKNKKHNHKWIRWACGCIRCEKCGAIKVPCVLLPEIEDEFKKGYLFKEKSGKIICFNKKK